MSTLKVYVGKVSYNRKTKERHIEIITKEERDERERLRKERDNTYSDFSLQILYN